MTGSLTGNRLLAIFFILKVEFSSTEYFYTLMEYEQRQFSIAVKSQSWLKIGVADLMYENDCA